MSSALPAVPAEYLDNLEKLSVGKVCLIGRELTQDLSRKLSIFLRCFKENLDKRNYLAPEFNTLLVTCNLLLQKIVECQIIVGRKLKKSDAMTPEEFLKISKERSLNPQKKTQARVEKEDEFERNRVKLIKLSNAMKWLDWQDAILSPRHLNKPQNAMMNTRQ
uniref:Nuclear nucleic acid-binding protein C1D n=1 Tax=Parastrongyloides trichosuri TaxID=131310 RepID=A0A0N4ZFZ9_PARTI